MSRKRRRVTLNISGELYQTYEKTLARFPGTLLGDLSTTSPHYSTPLNEYFFHRCRRCFSAILFFYQSNGILRCPKNMPVNYFADECYFFRLPDNFISEMKKREGILPPAKSVEILPVGSTTLRERIWDILERPETSTTARSFALFSLSIILFSIITACLETIPAIYNATRSEYMWSDPWVVTELVVTSWFLVELTLRFLFAPSKSRFAKEVLNIVDFIAVAPYFVALAFSRGKRVTSLGWLRILRMIRVVRLVRLSKHSKRIQIMMRVLKSCMSDFQMLTVCLSMFMIFGGSIIYFFEEGSNNLFTSIPDSFYWSIVTLTTVGYGDITPTTKFGKLVSSCFMILGTITLMLPILAIVSKFIAVYEQNTEEGVDQ